MARQRDPRREEAFQIWKESKGSIKLKDIAERLGVADTQIRKWKSQDKWEPSKGNVTNSKRNVTNEERSPATKKRSGNPNPTNQFAKRNNAAEKYGLFSKYLPEETQEIMEAMYELSAADLVWQQLQIQYAAIIRAQQIMYVTSKEEMVKEIKKRKFDYILEPNKKSGKSFKKVVIEEEFELQFAWDRQANFLNAQSRAMSEVRNLIKQFEELAHSEDERRLKLEQMQLAIDKTKAEINRIAGESDSEDDAIDDWVEAVTADE